MPRLFVLSIVVVTAEALASPSTAASTLTVDLKGSAEFTDIQSAIDAAENGDTVLVKPGEYVIAEPMEFNRRQDSPAWAMKNVMVRSERGAQETIIRLKDPTGDSKSPSVVVFDDYEDASSVLQGFTMTGGLGAGICTIRSCPTIEDCVMVGNGRFGVYAEDGDPVLERCRISSNLGGGVYASQSNPTLLYCTISENSGPGVWLHRSSRTRHPPVLRNCTITANASNYCGGIYCSESGPTVTNCIVWGNIGGSVLSDNDPPPKITFSCIGPEPYPGFGNINEDPRFCGWKEPGEVYVDAESPGEGTGTKADPFRTLHSALDFSIALSPLSPCLNAGENWTDMGSQNGACMLARTKRVIHLAAGNYDLDGLTFFHGASLQGAGKGLTVLRGSLLGLRSGATLGGVTVSGGKRGGVCIPGAESPEIVACEISDNSSDIGAGGGIFCGDGSARIADCVIKRNSAVCGGSLCMGGGGGIASNGGSPHISDCTISENISEFGGASTVAVRRF